MLSEDGTGARSIIKCWGIVVNETDLALAEWSLPAAGGRRDRKHTNKYGYKSRCALSMKQHNSKSAPGFGEPGLCLCTNEPF